MKIFWLLCISILFFPCFAQDLDTANSSVQSFSTYADDDDTDATALPDSSDIKTRDFNPSSLNQLKSDKDLRYKELPTVAESLWDRILVLLGEFLDSLFSNAVGTDWGRVFMYFLGIVLIVVLVMMLLKVDALKVFYSGYGTSTMPHHVLHENIHEMDFDTLINDAVAQRDYRKAIRLLFLSSLKTLADQNLIHWEQGKTNHDYLKELTADNLKAGFNELNYYFEYAWYGNFSVSDDTFLKVQGVFNEWKTKVP